MPEPMVLMPYQKSVGKEARYEQAKQLMNELAAEIAFE